MDFTLPTMSIAGSDRSDHAPGSDRPDHARCIGDAPREKLGCTKKTRERRQKVESTGKIGSIKKSEGAARKTKEHPK